MADLAVRVENLGKSYLLGQMNPYRTLREALTELPARLRHRGTEGSIGRDSMWALRHLSFELPQGEALGIIGHNGAGKSTLLKLLSRVTSPTEGRAEVVGRVSALLEVGTGFHPELTGRENVYLNGSVLGMRRAEIDAKFDAIVDFAGVAAHIDTPIKRYSSGMQVRLAFAVAAHLEPEVLIVDEVLAVGDAAFQRKCLGTLERSAQGGRTVLFVSHNLPAVRSLCKRAIVLEKGGMVFEGSADEAVEFYLTRRAAEVAGTGSVAELPRSAGYFVEGALRFSDLSLNDGDDAVVLRVGDPLRARIRFEVSRPLDDVVVRFNIYSLDDVLVGQAGSSNQHPPFHDLRPGSYELDVSVGAVDLQPGRYAVGLAAADASHPQDVVHPVAYFDVIESLDLPPALASSGGYLRLRTDWSLPARVADRAPSTPRRGGRDE